jgi:predicted DsbA family dithiol-disulfide isomerase
VRIERLRREYEIEVCWRAFPLHPDTPEEGLTLEELFAGRSVDSEQMMARLRQVAGELGLPLGKREKTYNSRLAQELGKWAESLDRGDAFHKAVFRAYFLDGRNIGKIPELVELSKSMGLPAEEALRVLETRAFREAVDSDWSLAYKMNVTAVPTFLMGRRAVVGAQPYEVLQQLMKVCGVKKGGRA